MRSGRTVVVKVRSKRKAFKDEQEVVDWKDAMKQLYAIGKDARMMGGSKHV